MSNKASKTDLVAAITAKDPTFKYSKKKHTIAALTKILATSKNAGKSRMADGIRKATTDEVTVPGRDSKRMVILKALKEGATIEGLMKVTNWKRQSVTGALLTDVRAIGFSYEVKGPTLKLIMPKGVSLDA